MRVAVTYKDILDGERDIATRCPVALALGRTTGRTWAVYQNRLWKLGGGPELNTPPAVRDFIRRFDEGAAVAPFAFELAT